MRILYAGNFEWPSEQARAIQTIHTAHALARAGSKVRLMTMRPWSPMKLGVAQALALYGLESHPRLSVKSITVAQVPEALRFIEIHKRLAVTNLSYCAGAALSLLRMPPGARPAWVFTRDPRVAWTFIKLRSLTRVKVVYEAHELFGTRPRDNRSLEQGEQWGVANRTRALESFVLQQSDRLITLTEACRRLIVDSEGVSESLVRAIPDGADVPTGRTAVAADKRSIFYVGQLYRWKGVDTLVRALAEVSNATLTIVGSGVQENGTDIDRARLEQLSGSLGLSDRVKFHAFVPYHQVPRCLAQASVAVVPLPDVLMSRYFTSPLKLFDAMAAGTPLVASNLDSIREILRDGENGVLVEPDSPTALAAGLRRVLDDPPFAAAIAATARAEAAQYTWERRAERILEHLDQQHG